MRKIYLLIVIVVTPLWITGAFREIRDQFAVREDGEVVQGKIVMAEWVQSRPDYVKCEVTYPAGNQKVKHRFKLNLDTVGPYVAPSGQITQPEIQVLRSKSRPTAAELVVEPTDSPWGSIAVATFGFVVFMGAMGWLYFRDGRKASGDSRLST